MRGGRGLQGSELVVQGTNSRSVEEVQEGLLVARAADVHKAASEGDMATMQGVLKYAPERMGERDKVRLCYAVGGAG